mmetsp:Transcript_13741/g.23401  ORF Transcript_13741/g.23401 Transcript_13741/m.23401 type:complete len:80 (-) Transcript_13741:438-677(-)
MYAWLLRPDCISPTLFPVDLVCGVISIDISAGLLLTDPSEFCSTSCPLCVEVPRGAAAGGDDDDDFPAAWICLRLDRVR